MEVVEGITARLQTSWATRFRGGERARRRRRTVGNGGAAALLLRSYRRAEEKQMEQASRSAGARGVAQVVAGRPGHPRRVAA